MNWKTFWKGALAASVGGAVTGTATYISVPENISGVALGKRVGFVAGVGALLALAAYFKQPPAKE